MSVILHEDVRIFLFDGFHEAAQRGGTAHAGHIFQSDLIAAESHHLVHHAHVILHGVDVGVGDAEGHLRDHARLFGELDGVFEVARVVQSAERAGDVHALRFLHLEHQLAHVGGHGVHAEGVERTLQHLALYAGLPQRLGPGADGLVGVLAIQKVHLFEGTAVGFHAGETAAVHDGGRHTH